MIPQWSDGLPVPVQNEGCLFLCYLWAGWLYGLQHMRPEGGMLSVRPGRRLAGFPPVTDATIAESYDVLYHMGHIRADCFVVEPINVIRFPWHYWDGLLPPEPESEPRILVTKEPPYAKACNPLWAMADHQVSPHPVATVFDITRWELLGKSHFTGLCRRPAAGYFDPWVISRIAGNGLARSVRRVAITPAE